MDSVELDLDSRLGADELFTMLRFLQVSKAWSTSFLEVQDPIPAYGGSAYR